MDIGNFWLSGQIFRPQELAFSNTDSVYKQRTCANQFRRIVLIMKTTYSIAEVADYFRVSTRTIRVWLHKDASFPRPFKKYGTLRFKCSEVEQYWNENTMEAGSLPTSAYMDYKEAG